jgi:hypothetical protein
MSNFVHEGIKRIDSRASFYFVLEAHQSMGFWILLPVVAKRNQLQTKC